MPVLPWLAARPPAPSVRRAPSLSPSPLIPLPLPASSAFSSSSWSSRTKGGLSPRGPFATAADAPLGGPLPEPEERDPLLLAALRAARLRDEESRRPVPRTELCCNLTRDEALLQLFKSWHSLSWKSSDPLFVDPYAAVLLSLDVASQDKDTLALHLMPSAEHYRLVTRYIDDKLQHLISNSDDLRQIVLLTDGMDTRPYRLSWPRLSVLYDVSPRRVFRRASQQLRGAGAKVSRNCVVLHTPLESPDLQEGLCKNGFNGNRPSLWVLQGLSLSTFTSWEDLLLIISNLAMKGSIFIGEVPRFSEWRGAADMASEQDRLENLFFTRGFQVSFVHYEKVAKDVGLCVDSPSEIRDGALFIAEQLRFSDAQMESFRMHFERIEEDADEEGFEEL